MHYSLIVIGALDELKKRMAPFSEGLEVPEYCVGPVTEEDRKRMIDYYNKEKGEEAYNFDNFDALYAERGNDWNVNHWRKDEDGVWQEYSTYNPNSKWDWYEVGGRWAGSLEVKDSAKTEPVNFSYGWSEASKKKVLDAKPKRADSARKGDILNLDTLHAWSVLKDGEWYESDYTKDESLQVLPYLADVPDDAIITMVDYHI